MLVVVSHLDKTNIAVVLADRKFLSDMTLMGQQARMGLLSTIFFIGYGAGLPAWGIVVDYLGPRRALSCPEADRSKGVVRNPV